MSEIPYVVYNFHLWGVRRTSVKMSSSFLIHNQGRSQGWTLEAAKFWKDSSQPGKSRKYEISSPLVRPYARLSCTVSYIENMLLGDL